MKMGRHFQHRVDGKWLDCELQDVPNGSMFRLTDKEEFTGDETIYTASCVPYKNHAGIWTIEYVEIIVEAPKENED
jgi:hypothetical protein